MRLENPQEYLALTLVVMISLILHLIYPEYNVFWRTY